MEEQASSRPLLTLPPPSAVARERRLGGPPSRPHLPTWQRQRERLLPQFAALERAFAPEQATLARDPAGAIPEHVLVLETVGAVDDFMATVRRIPGMEWLAEWDDSVSPDDDFYRDEEHRDVDIPGQVLLVMSNQQALRELLSLWHHYETDPSGQWDYGRTRWRDLFTQLRSIRPWDVQDRLRDTGILDDWRERVAERQEHVRFEIELWFRDRPEERAAVLARVEQLLQGDGGKVVSHVALPAIAYHGLLAELPIQQVAALVERPDTRLLRSDQVMFFRPVGQAVVGISADEPPVEQMPPANLPLSSGEPVVALLDGLPLENHRWLVGRLRIDDPDDWAAAHPPQDRAHGTSMASLIVHGDLSARESPLTRPVYVRPILRPDPQDFRSSPREEGIPDDVLPVDLIHRAVRRLFESEAGQPPVAPHVCIINLSVGDRARPFDRFPSPWARLLDWLSYRYRILFMVSTGNFTENVEFGVSRSTFDGWSAAEREAATLQYIVTTAARRAVLTPSEAVNAITIGAIHSDSSTYTPISVLTNLFVSTHLPSPITRVGPGFGGAVKPEILMPGGRQLYREVFATTPGATFEVVGAVQPPGQQVATPGATPGVLSATRHTRGTSNATALTSRAAARLYEMLEQLSQDSGGLAIADRDRAVIVKALLVHGSRWGGAYASLAPQVQTVIAGARPREHAARFLGYGALDVMRVLSCTDQRATLFGHGKLSDGEAHLYRVPLPPSLSGQATLRRLTITLAWLTPTNPVHRRYRRAALWFEPNRDLLHVERREATARAVRRGTVQHEVLDGDRATAYTDGATLDVQVNCRAAAGVLSEAVPYALAMSLEVDEGISLPIYEEIRARVQVRTPVRVRPVTFS